MSSPSFKVVVCRGPECGDQRGSAAIHEAFTEALGRAGLAAAVELSWQSCFGRCTRGPNVLVRHLPAGTPQRSRFSLATMPAPRGSRSVLYNRVTPGDVVDIVREHIAGGRPVRRLLDAPTRSGSAPTATAPRLPTPPGTEGDS